MNGPRDSHGSETPTEAAARWFVRLQDEAAGPEAWEALEVWLAASPEHLAAYERVERTWVEAEDLPPEALPGLEAPTSLAARRDRGLSRRAWLGLGGGAVAAAAAALAVGVIPFGAAPPAQIYTTAPGQTRAIALADGTRIRLNAGSHITVRLEKRVRRVEMADAEATFDVAHDPSRPFLIAVGDRQVRVVGTEFNLRRRDGQIALSVRRGLVEVRPADALQAEPTRVAAGQRLVHHEGTGISTVAAAEPGVAFAWTEGRLIYQDAPLSEVAADLSRSLGFSIRVADAATGRIRFTGVLVLDDRAAVLRRLEAFAPVRVERRAPGEAVLHKIGSRMR